MLIPFLAFTESEALSSSIALLDNFDIELINCGFFKYFFYELLENLIVTQLVLNWGCNHCKLFWLKNSKVWQVEINY